MASMWSFEITGGEEVKKGLAVILDNLKDLTPFWREVWAPKYFAVVQDLFKTGGAARGTGGKFKGGNWAWLSPKYRAWKAVHYPGAPILVRTGEMRESVRWYGTNLGPGGLFDPHPSYVIAGTTIPYAKYHQTGTKHMPARPFLPPPDPAVIVPLLQQWLLKVNKS